MVIPPVIRDKAKKIEFLLTDCDGVLTDGSVFVSPEGEALKKFSFRDGMGVERLRKIVNVDVGIITGEDSPIVAKRAEKLGIEELHLGIKDKLSCVKEILKRRNLDPKKVAYIGDDMNDLEVLQYVGLSCCPRDAFAKIQDMVDFQCLRSGGEGVLREICEVIIYSKQGLV